MSKAKYFSLFICESTKRILLFVKNGWGNDPGTYDLLSVDYDFENVEDEIRSKFEQVTGYGSSIEFKRISENNFLCLISVEAKHKENWMFYSSEWLELEQLLKVHKSADLEKFLQENIEAIKKEI